MSSKITGLDQNRSGARVAVFATAESAQALVHALGETDSTQIEIMGWPVSEVLLARQTAPPDLVVCEISDARQAGDNHHQLHRLWPDSVIVSYEKSLPPANGASQLVCRTDKAAGFLEEASKNAGYHAHLTVNEAALQLPLFLRYAHQRRRTEMRLARIEQIFNAFSRIVISLDLQRVAAAIIEELSRWIPAESWLLYTLSDDGQFLELTLAEGIRVRPHSMRLPLQAAQEFISPLTHNLDIAEKKGEDMSFRYLSAIIGTDSPEKSAASLSETCVPDLANSGIATDPEAASTSQKPSTGRQVLCLPLSIENQVVGLIEAVGPACQTDRKMEEARWAGHDEQMLAELTHIASVALNNALRFERAERMYMQDDLTTLHNSRFLRQYIEREVKRAKRYGSRFSVLFIDLDGFKEVNDRFGHRVGSDTLCEVAKLLNNQVRETDIVARYGGDEYTLVLPETDAAKAMFTAERIRQAVEKQVFSTGKGENFKLTISVGVAAYPDHAESAMELLEKADFAMYEAKAANKNNVRLAS
jgi:diguanylate cyclase (GGDEF)-like protein